MIPQNVRCTKSNSNNPNSSSFPTSNNSDSPCPNAPTVMNIDPFSANAAYCDFYSSITLLQNGQVVIDEFGEGEVAGGDEQVVESMGMGRYWWDMNV